jgi:hypothetical protein
VSEEDAAATWDHIAHSPNCSIAKAQRFLAYTRRYTSLQAVEEALTWSIEQTQIEVSSRSSTSLTTRTASLCNWRCSPIGPSCRFRSTR